MYAVGEFGSVTTAPPGAQSTQPHYFTTSGTAFVGNSGNSHTTIASDPYILPLTTEEEAAMVVQQAPSPQPNSPPQNHTQTSTVSISFPFAFV